jgi:hypothetical protein
MDDLRVIKALFIIDSDGARMFGKHYDLTLPASMTMPEFEKTLFTRTCKSTVAVHDIDVTVFEDLGLVVLFRCEADVHFYMVASLGQNEAFVAAALTALVESLRTLFQEQFDKRTLLEHYDALVVAVDEVVDSGVVMETDPLVVTNRVILQGAEDGIGSTNSSSSAEPTLASIFKQAKEQLERTILK